VRLESKRLESKVRREREITSATLSISNFGRKLYYLSCKIRVFTVAAAADQDMTANSGSASKTTNPFSKIKTYLTGMHPTSVHQMGGCLTGVYLTGVYLTGVYLTGVSLIGVCLYTSRACMS
jgi:hypothetical protein